MYLLLSSPLLCIGGGNKKAYLHRIGLSWFRGKDLSLNCRRAKNMSVLKVFWDIITLGIAEYSVHEEFVHVLYKYNCSCLIYVHTYHEW